MMRALLIRLTLWLAVRLQVNLIDHARLHGGSDAVERGARWEAFYREQGGLADFFNAVRRGYFEAAAGLGISDTDKIYEYALADRIAREIERQVQSVVQNGKIEADRIASESRARVASIRR